MELSNFFQKSNNLEYLGKSILDGSINIDVFLELLDESPDWMEDNISGEISDSTLSKIIDVSYFSQNYSLFLTYIMEIVDGNSINDVIFQKILSHPNIDIKERLVISLSHKKLEENQLRCLCDEGITFECYFELAILYYTDSAYTLEILKRFMEDFLKCKYSYMVNEIIAELMDYHIASNKTKYEYVRKQSGDGSKPLKK